MQEIKDTQRAEVHIGFDGRVHKKYKGHFSKERYENEVRMLKYLEEKGCDFVPKLMEEHPEQLYIVTTNCGNIVHKISSEKVKSIFDALEFFGVRHDDAFMRNITYSPHLGKFCVIDFEFAVILETGEGLTIKEAEEAKGGDHERKTED
ncbi:serine/threonine protein phosphatase [Pelagicoccus sp. SDUM812002]|uniref:serine/threonine protein phosphatase n=1 Tax=Pelagicoccus sp. SDUM812002 TaxID=3041266 RepID=UPI00280F90B5|nr:serine/threonine protein phosphatase [Pelagicoccus sp. SDUM812002]MDQ8184467.1 serine/threonine protein phosphatase [Pelagicoccus sp. SDUM812002]